MRPPAGCDSPNEHHESSLTCGFLADSERRKVMQNAKSKSRGARRIETDVERLTIAKYKAATSRRVIEVLSVTSTSTTMSSTRTSFRYSIKAALNLSSGITAESSGLLSHKDCYMD
jgi:hypothetical protein